MLDTHQETQRGEATCPGAHSSQIGKMEGTPRFWLQRLPAPENQRHGRPFCPGAALDLCPTGAAAGGRDEVGRGSQGSPMGEVVKSHFGHPQKLFVKGLEHQSCLCRHRLEDVTLSAFVAGVRRDPVLRQPRASLWPFHTLLCALLQPLPASLLLAFLPRPEGVEERAPEPTCR